MVIELYCIHQVWVSLGTRST